MWFDFKEEKPMFSKLYLVWFEGDFEFAYWFADQQKFNIYVCDEYKVISDDCITHWQAIESP